MDFSDVRQRALFLARARIVIGLVHLVAPCLIVRVLFGPGASTPASRTFARLMGVRDVVLGIGAITTVKEHTLDAEWVSAGAAADAVDGLAILVTPRVPAYGRLFSLVSGTAAALGLQAAREMADQRTPA
jgi:hypothetical protein